jgi:predicted RNA-binding Zn-ribbon protein involved in translation (DUF1610 family)
MWTFRKLTAHEQELLNLVNHERRSADSFQCPHCGSITGASTCVTSAAICKCHACGGEFFAWAVPGLIHVSARVPEMQPRAGAGEGG